MEVARAKVSEVWLDGAGRRLTGRFGRDGTATALPDLERPRRPIHNQLGISIVFKIRKYLELTSLRLTPLARASLIKPIVASSACLFRFNGVRRSIPELISCGERVVDE